MAEFQTANASPLQF